MSRSSIIIALLASLAGCNKLPIQETDTRPIGAPQYEVPKAYHTPTPPPASGWVKIQAQRWDKAQIRPEKEHFVEAITAQIVRSRKRYDTVATATGVPWPVIASIHNMECSLSFRQNLANGDPLTSQTRHVPRGRPPGIPPFTWEQAAVDALKFDHLDRETWGDIGNELQNVELYNGSGYQRFHPSVPSPYLYSWTSIYARGKYVADGQWSSTAVSDQCGVVSLLKCLK